MTHNDEDERVREKVQESHLPYMIVLNPFSLKSGFVLLLSSLHFFFLSGHMNLGLGSVLFVCSVTYHASPCTWMASDPQRFCRD